MKSTVLILFMSLIQMSIIAQAKLVCEEVEDEDTRVATPWVPIARCNKGEFILAKRDLTPPGHQFTIPTGQEYQMILGKNIAKKAIKANSKVAEYLDAKGSLTVNSPDTQPKISLCENDKNCPNGPNFIFEMTPSLAFGSKHDSKSTLKFLEAVGGSIGQVGESVDLICE